MSREAMQMALEVLEKVITAFGSGLTLQQNAITALRQALETEQEPVAHIDHRIHSWPDCFVIRADPPHTSPLYLSLPKREWVGLIDEEIQDLSYLSQKIDASNSPWFDRLEFARAIEAKLKEKNQ